MEQFIKTWEHNSEEEMNKALEFLNEESGIFEDGRISGQTGLI